MTTQEKTSAMLKLVKEFNESGQSQKAFSSLHGLTEGKLNYWICKFKKSQFEGSRSVAPAKDFVSIGVVPLQENRSILIRCQSGVEIEIPL